MRSVVFVAVLFVLIFNNSNVQATLKSTYNQADYIVIYHPEFQENIKKFVQWRQEKGVTVYSVDVNEIYRDFQDTNSQVDAIRNFVSYALEYWNNPKPRFLLLVGGINHIPSKQIDSYFGFLDEYFIHVDDFVADNKYNDDTSRIIPDIAIGRFPVRNSQDLDIMIEKTIMFEDSSYFIQYKNDFLISADKDDYKLFEHYAENIIDNILPDFLNIQRFDYREESTFYGSKNDFIQHINDGSIMLINFFHGGANIWMSDTLITSEDIDTLNFTEKPFIINGMSCKQNWDDSTNKGIIEKLLCKPRSGAVASFASAGLNYAETSFELIEDEINDIVNNYTRELGIAVLNSKLIQPNSYKERFTLLGDPMLKIPNRIVAGVQNTPPNETIIQIFPNPCTDYAVIQFNASIGETQIEILDVLGNAIKSEDIQTTNGLNEYFLDADELANGTYLVRIRQGVTILHSKVIINN